MRIILILFIFPTIFFGQETNNRKLDNKEIFQSVNYLSERDSLYGITICFKSDTLNRTNGTVIMAFSWLTLKASDKDLVKISKDKNSILSIYGIWARSIRHDSSVVKIIKQKMKDKKTIFFKDGCKVESIRVCDFLIKLVTPNEIDDRVIKLNEKELVDLKNLASN